MSISVLILVSKNDASLRRAIMSSTWADEVLLGWTGTIDPTQADREQLQLLEHALKIHRIPGEVRDYAAARNSLHSKVSSDWIFWLDSDEVIPAESVPSIRSVAEQRKYEGALVQRRDIFAGKMLEWGEVRNVKLVRMFRQASGRFIRPVHEVALVSGEVADPGTLIEHYAHSSISSFLRKVIHYAQLEAQLRYNKGRKAHPIEVIVWPLGKFLSNVFLHGAFLDGWQGISYAVVMSMHSLAVRAMLIELWQKKV